MTELLERAFAEAAKLSPEQQDQVAQWLLDELASDREWDRRLAGSAKALKRLAKEAVEEHRAGLTEELDVRSR